MDEAHECGDGFLASQGNTAEAFELVEETFDLMPLLVEPPVDGRRDGAAGIGADLRGGAKIVGDEGAKRIGVIGGICDDVTNARQTGQESFGLREVVMIRDRCSVGSGLAVYRRTPPQEAASYLFGGMRRRVSTLLCRSEALRPFPKAAIRACTPRF